MLCEISKYFGKCFGQSTPAPKSSFWLICPCLLLLKFTLQLKLVQFNLWYGSGYLESASQVQFSGSSSQDSGSQRLNFQVPGTYFQVSVCQGPGVLGSPFPESRISGSQGPASRSSNAPGLRVLGSQVVVSLDESKLKPVIVFYRRFCNVWFIEYLFSTRGEACKSKRSINCLCLILSFYYSVLPLEEMLIFVGRSLTEKLWIRGNKNFVFLIFFFIFPFPCFYKSL